MQKIAILSNVNLDILIQKLKKDYDVFAPEGYGQWFKYALQKDASLLEFGPQTIFLLMDGFALLENCTTDEEAQKETSAALSNAERLAENYPESIVFVSTIHIRHCSVAPENDGIRENRWCSLWNEQLPVVSKNRGNINLFNLAALIGETGAGGFYSDRMWYMGSIPYSVKGMGELARAIDEAILRSRQTPKKVLVLDLDNTLWGGVLGEEGAQGVTLGSSLMGAAYRDAQKHIREMKEMGVLLAVVSKNNEGDVMEIFERNPQMVLKREDFAAILASWDPKPESIRKLSGQLNLGLDSFVFLDDNPVEREAVKIALPMVSVAEFPKDVANLPETIRGIYLRYFYRSSTTAEDKVKTGQYQAEAARQREKDRAESAGTLGDFIRSLEIKITINEATDGQTDRIIQLTNKTNQFNTCTVRFDRQSYLAFRSAGNHHVYAVNASDRYGDNGLILVAMVTVDGDAAEIENFLMSCRVMGRKIEDAVIEAIENRLYEDGIRTLRARYVPTAKNKPVEKLWDTLGYKTAGEDGDGTKRYSKLLSGPENAAILKTEWR
ncbi:MAG: HAD-IIIC family phosphatase [Lachnospiraceae bacterium]|nr:HAD-IIIC family phosphatase [Lachnospiraceae bacterium]